MEELVTQQPGGEETLQLMVNCPRCGQYKPAHQTDRHLCVDCARAENTRVTYYRQHQEDWIANAKENGIDIWAQQPGETQWEFTVWTAYRDSYPGKKPTATWRASLILHTTLSRRLHRGGHSSCACRPG